MEQTQIKVTINFLQGTYKLVEVMPLYCLVDSGDVYTVDHDGNHYIVPLSCFE